jgi:assimilatory nitrate reductase catalytic subunit
VFQILKRVTTGQPCDITGIEDYRALDASGGIQWPLTNVRGERDAVRAADNSAHTSHLAILASNERRLFEDGKFFHPDGKARILFEAPRPMPEPTSPEFQFVLLTGRGTSAQWHTQTRTGKSDVLRKLAPEKIYLEISPADAERLGIDNGTRVLVQSRRGKLTATAFVTPGVSAGQVFLPMHYEETNRLTHWHVDPHSRQPGYKSCAVNVQRLRQ